PPGLRRLPPPGTDAPAPVSGRPSARGSGRRPAPSRGGDGTHPRTSCGDVVGKMTSGVRPTILAFAAVAIASFFRMYDGATLSESVRGTHGFATRWLGVGGGGIESQVRPQRREGRLDRDHRRPLGDRDRTLGPPPPFPPSPPPVPL